MTPLAALPLPNALHNERSGTQLFKKKKKKPPKSLFGALAPSADAAGAGAGGWVGLNGSAPLHAADVEASLLLLSIRLIVIYPYGPS